MGGSLEGRFVSTALEGAAQLRVTLNSSCLYIDSISIQTTGITLHGMQGQHTSVQIPPLCLCSTVREHGSVATGSQGQSMVRYCTDLEYVQRVYKMYMLKQVNQELDKIYKSV